MAYQEKEHVAFVVSKRDQEYFAYCSDIPKDLIISATLSPKDVNILGRWVRVSVHRGNSVCRPVRIIDDVFESRMWNATPQIKLDIKYDGIYENNLKMFMNDYVGYVSDPNHVMTNFDRYSSHVVWIERFKANGTNSRWRVSQTQDRYHSKTYSLNKTVQGIIHTFDNGAYYAWSKSEPKSRIYIDSKYCTKRDHIYLGSWVEMEIDASKSVQSEVIVIKDPFNTFSSAGFVEIEVEFESQSNSPGSYFHPYFGNICDPRMILDRAEQGAVYSGKITYYHDGVTDSRWRLALKQQIYGPLTKLSNRSSGADFYDQTERKIYSRPQSRNGNRRDSSPDIMNVYNYRNDSRNSDGFTPPRRNSTDRGHNQDQWYYDDRDKYGYDNRRKYSDDDDDREFRSTESNQDNYARDYDRHDSQRKYPDDMSDKRHDMGKTSSEYRFPRDSSPTTERFERRHSPNAYPSEKVGTKRSESSVKLNRSEAVPDNSRCDGRTSRAPSTDSESESIDEEKMANVLFRSYEEKQEQLTNKHNKPEVDKSVNHRIKTKNLTPEEKEIIILTWKINQIRARFEFFTADEDIDRKMRFTGVEEYEELANLLK